MDLGHDLRGVEFDWLLVDADGFVAQMASAGSGLVPLEVLTRPDDFDRAIDEILALPASCEATLTPDASGDCRSWIEFARRGLYAYDSDPNGGPYRLIARPTVPVRIEALPPIVTAVVSNLPRPNQRFRAATSFAPEELACVTYAR